MRRLDESPRFVAPNLAFLHPMTGQHSAHGLPYVRLLVSKAHQLLLECGEFLCGWHSRFHAAVFTNDSRNPFKNAGACMFSNAMIFPSLA